MHQLKAALFEHEVFQEDWQLYYCIGSLTNIDSVVLHFSPPGTYDSSLTVCLMHSRDNVK